MRQKYSSISKSQTFQNFMPYEMPVFKVGRFVDSQISILLHWNGFRQLKWKILDLTFDKYFHFVWRRKIFFQLFSLIESEQWNITSYKIVGKLSGLGTCKINDKTNINSNEKLRKMEDLGGFGKNFHVLY